LLYPAIFYYSEAVQTSYNALIPLFLSVK